MSTAVRWPSAVARGRLAAVVGDQHEDGEAERGADAGSGRREPRGDALLPVGDPDAAVMNIAVKITPSSVLTRTRPGTSVRSELSGHRQPQRASAHLQRGHERAAQPEAGYELTGHSGPGHHHGGREQERQARAERVVPPRTSWS